MKIHISILFLMSLVAASCGAKVDSVEVKEFRVSLAGGDTRLLPLLKLLVQNYNQNAGLTAIQYVDSPESANSRVYFVEGLEERDGKVGWGQWFAETEKTGMDMPGATIDKTTRYSLQAEFDADFFREHSELENGMPSLEVQKLFAHEIGHGFQMEHAPQQSDVMYFDVTGEKDFNAYWPRVRSFFGIE